MRYEVHGSSIEVVGDDALPARFPIPLQPSASAGHPDIRVELGATDGIVPSGREIARDARVAIRAGPEGVFVVTARATARVSLDGSSVVAFVPSSGGQDEVLTALTIALRIRGVFHVHAAGLVSPCGAGVVVTGHSGHGKSTLAARLVEHGWRYLGDDALLLGLRSGEPVLHPFSRAFRIAPRSLAAMPHLEAHATGAMARGKPEISAESAFPGQRRQEMSPSTLLFAHIADAEDTGAAPLAAADALGKLLATSAFATLPQIPNLAAHHAALAALVNSVRCYEVALGRDVLDRPRSAIATIEALLT